VDKPRKDDIITLTIDDIVSDGRGIGRYNGEFVIFVPQTVPGDVITAKIRKTKKNYSEAKLLDVTVPSPFRVTPECEYFGTCNGCKMQNTGYSRQLEIKRKIVSDAFAKIGGFQDIKVPAVIGSQNIYFYRNKLEFSFSNDRWLTLEDMQNENADRSFALGYHIPGFIDKIIDIRKCYLQSIQSSKILNLTRDFFKSRNISVYSTKTHSGYLRFLVIRQSANTNDLMVNLITHTDEPTLIADYSIELKRNIPEVTTLINSISASKAQVASADNFSVLFGKGYIEEKIGDYTFKITPNSFFQTNSRQCEVLFQKALDIAEFNSSDNVLDLYCGGGAISIYISGHVKNVYGVELSTESIEMANVNAKLNNVGNCEFEAKDVKDFLQELTGDLNKHKRFDVIILDPPRSGIHPKAADYLLEYEAKKIIYLSCNTGTQARDLQLLSSKYKITFIQPVDMFPHTFHIENIVRLELI
jgi:23S rRNA (uracil1939-C5)-methyltransferase